MKQGVVIAFGELFLKSRDVKNLLVRRLVSNIETSLDAERVQRFHDRLFVPSDDLERVVDVVKDVFGISWFSRGALLESVDSPTSFVKDRYEEWIEEDETFAIRIVGSGGLKNKSEIIDEVAKEIDRKVDLTSPDKTVFLERKKEGWLVYVDRETGLGGLPVGSGGKVMTLISGGIDSPVASYLTMKRGVSNVLVHFHSFPLVSRKSIEKVEDLANVLSRYQPNLKLILVPFSEIQKRIRVGAPEKYLTVLYRREMLRIAEELARDEGCAALVTGESLGQVSSQTLNNICVTNRVVDLPILRPLLGMDKEEIVRLAKKVGTYDISIQPHEDCCTLFVTKGQSAECKLVDVEEVEKELSLEPFDRKNTKIKIIGK